MSTNSNIGILNSDNSVTAIYCHWDGYISHVGYMLHHHYNTESKVRALIRLGSISALYEHLEPTGKNTHDYLNPEPNVTVAYARDRDEDYERCKPKVYRSIADYRQNASVRYLYYFNPASKTWYVSDDPCGDWKLLQTELEGELDPADPDDYEQPIFSIKDLLMCADKIRSDIEETVLSYVEEVIVPGFTDDQVDDISEEITSSAKEIVLKFISDQTGLSPDAILEMEPASEKKVAVKISQTFDSIVVLKEKPGETKAERLKRIQDYLERNGGTETVINQNGTLTFEELDEEITDELLETHDVID